jgi:hypothetical protein
MALEITQGYTDDGLIFLRFIGQQEERGRPLQTVINIETDMAEKMARQILDDCRKARFACKRPLVLGQEQTFKKG